MLSLSFIGFPFPLSCTIYFLSAIKFFANYILSIPLFILLLCFISVFIYRKKSSKHQRFKDLRGAGRIWTGAYWCCRPLPYHLATAPYSDSNGIWTRVTAVKGRCLNRLTMEPLIYYMSRLWKISQNRKTPRVGLEPTTTRLTAECSTIELSRIIISLPYPPYLQNRTPSILYLTFLTSSYLFG